MNRRMLLWLVLLAAAAVVRWIDPLHRDPEPVVAATPRSMPPDGAVQAASSDLTKTDTYSPAADIFNAPTGNAFKTRGSPVVVAMAAPIPQPKSLPSRVVVAVDNDAPLEPPPPPPPSPPPLQVIGTWDDGNAPGVFLAGPHGTVLARSGQVLLDDYKVQKITNRELVLTQLSNQREWPLAIPAMSPTPPMLTKR